MEEMAWLLWVLLPQGYEGPGPLSLGASQPGQALSQPRRALAPPSFPSSSDLHWSAGHQSSPPPLHPSPAHALAKPDPTSHTPSSARTPSLCLPPLVTLWPSAFPDPQRGAVSPFKPPPHCVS